MHKTGFGGGLDPSKKKEFKPLKIFFGPQPKKIRPLPTKKINVDPSKKMWTANQK